MQRIVKNVQVELPALIMSEAVVYLGSVAVAKQRAEEKAISDYIREHGISQIDWKNVVFEFSYQYRIIPAEVPELEPGKVVD